MKRIFYLFILISFSIAAQTKGTVLDENNSPIPYANIWIENENSGTTSEENGEFTIKSSDQNKNLIFSALGFEKKIVKISDSKQVRLKAVAEEIEEIVIQKSKNTIEHEIGNYKKGKINFYYGCWDKPWIIAKFFTYNDTIRQTPFLKKITIMSSSYKKGACFNLRILEGNKDGTPGNDLLEKNIVVKVKSGKNNNEIDLSEFNIKFPENGIFVSVEFLIIEENRYDIEVSFKDSKKKQIMSSYQPSIGTVPSDTSSTWRYAIGEWKKIQTKNTNKENENYFNKFSELAMKLTLTN